MAPIRMGAPGDSASSDWPWECSLIKAEQVKIFLRSLLGEAFPASLAWLRRRGPKPSSRPTCSIDVIQLVSPRVINSSRMRRSCCMRASAGRSFQGIQDGGASADVHRKTICEVRGSARSLFLLCIAQGLNSHIRCSEFPSGLFQMGRNCLLPALDGLMVQTAFWLKLKVDYGRGMG